MGGWVKLSLQPHSEPRQALRKAVATQTTPLPKNRLQGLFRNQEKDDVLSISGVEKAILEAINTPSSKLHKIELTDEYLGL